MNTSSFLLFALLGCLLCSPALGVSLRFVHGAPDIAPVNVFVDGDLKWGEIEYAWVVDSIDVSSDQPVHFEVYTASSNILLLEFDVPVQVPTSVALLDIGENTADYSIYLDVVDTEVLTRGRQAFIQVISLLPFGTSVSISRNRSSTALFPQVTSFEQILYTSTSSGFANLSFNDDRTGDLLMSDFNSFGANSYSTIWMFGDATADDFVVTISDDTDHVDGQTKPLIYV